MHREQEGPCAAADTLERVGSGYVRTASTQEVTTKWVKGTVEDSPEALDGVSTSQAVGRLWHES